MDLELRDMTIGYPPAPALCTGISLKLESGDFILLNGHSGCGKSSLLRTMNLLQSPQRGAILCEGEPILPQNVANFRRRVGYVQQSPIMVSGTVRQNLLFGFSFDSATPLPAPTDGYLREQLGRLQMNDVGLDAEATKLSVGQKQRISLVRAALMAPDILLCDEPTSALDADSQSIVEQWFDDLNQDRGIAVVLVTHTTFTCRRAQPIRYVFADKTLTKSETDGPD